MMTHYIASRPDHLFSRNEVMNSLKSLSVYNGSSRLKATLQGMTQISKIGAILQRIKQFFGGTNRASPILLKAESLKLLHQILAQNLISDQQISKWVSKIANNSALKGRYSSIHALFQKVHSHQLTTSEAKAQLLKHYTLYPEALKPSFYVPTPLNNEIPAEFGFGALEKIQFTSSLPECLDLFEALLGMDLNWRTLFQPLLALFNKKKSGREVSEHYPRIMELEKKLAGKAYLAGFKNEAADLYERTVKLTPDQESIYFECLLSLRDAPRLYSFLGVRDLALYSEKWNEILSILSSNTPNTAFFFFMLKAHKANLDLSIVRKRFVKLLLDYAPKAKNCLELYTIAFHYAQEEEITLEWILKMLELQKNTNDKKAYARLYFEVRQKAAKIADQLPKLTFESEEGLLHLINNAATSEEKQVAQLEYHLICKERGLTALKPDGLWTSLRQWWKGSKEPSKGDAAAIEAFRKAFQYADPIDVTADWIIPFANALVRRGQAPEAVDVLYKFMVLNPKEKLDQFPRNLLDNLFKKACLIQLQNPLTEAFTPFLQAGSSSLIAEHGGTIAQSLLVSSLALPRKREILDSILAIGRHAHLHFLKGEWTPNEEAEVKLLAYRWAYTLAEDNPFCRGQEVASRELLADEMAGTQDIARYRQDAMEAKGSP